MIHTHPDNTLPLRSRLAVAAQTLRSSFRSREPKLSIITDFGNGDEAAYAIRSSAKAVIPGLMIDDICHNVPLGNVLVGAWRLKRAVELPTESVGTAYVAVVDPGVGTERKSLIVKTSGGKYLIGPDNGVLSLAFESEGISAVVEIQNRNLTLLDSARSRTFHGKDVFAPVAAHILRGVPLSDFGRELDPATLARITISARCTDYTRSGSFVDVDGCGSLRTSVPNHLPSSVIGRSAKFSISGLDREVAGVAKVVKTFGEVGEGEAVFVQSSTGCLDLALNRGNASRAYGISAEQIRVGSDLKPSIGISIELCR